MSVFDAVVGQRRVRDVLERAVEDAAHEPPGPAMTHAWLFTGPPGSGRSVAARSFAAALVCPDGGCGVCPDCHTAMLGTHADVDHVATAATAVIAGAGADGYRLAVAHVATLVADPTD